MNARTLDEQKEQTGIKETDQRRIKPQRIIFILFLLAIISIAAFILLRFFVDRMP
jgi:uncharacterized membrane protein